MAVILSQMIAQVSQVQAAVDATKQVFLGDDGLKIEGVEQMNHPVSKRVFYMDAQLGNLNSANEIYDRKGELWKVFMVGKSHADSHLPVNKGAGIGIDDAFSMVDLQARHCTTGQFKGQVDPRKNPPSLFQVQNLRGGD